MGPVLLVIFINTIVFIVVMNKIKQSTKKRAKMGHVEPTVATMLADIRKDLKIAVSFVVLLGLTWILGAFAIQSAGIVFIYAFAICNALQGLFLALFQGLLRPA
jgi:Zn-dependent protease